MATIPRAALDYLTEEVNAVSADAQARVMRVLAQVDWSNVSDARAVVVEAVEMALRSSTALAAQASADFYDLARELAIGSAMGAQVIPGYIPEATEGAIRAAVQKIVDGKPVQVFNDFVLQRIDYEIKLAAANSTIANGRLDVRKPRFARVPTGSETCDFCLMLASRGFVYHTESTASMGHVHSSCDCRIVAGWDGMDVEGYDTRDIFDRWQRQMDAMAKERAERKGTTEDEEYDAIMRGYGRAARNAKRAGRSKA